MPTVVVMLVKRFLSDHGTSNTYSVSCRCGHGKPSRFTIDVETGDPWEEIALHVEDTGKDHAMIFRASTNGVEERDLRSKWNTEPDWVYDS